MSVHDDIETRAYRRDDEHEVVEVLRRALPSGDWSDQLATFRWKYERGVFGTAHRAVALRDGRVVGFYGMLPWQLELHGHRLNAGLVGDGAVHPDHQRRGVGRSLLAHALRRERAEGLDLYFGTPSDVTRRATSAAGWARPDARRERLDVYPLRPLRLVRRKLGGRTDRAPLRAGDGLRPVGELLVDHDPATIDDLLERSRPASRIATVRSHAYLRWRYSERPDRDYLGATVTGRDGRLRALLACRLVEDTGGLGHVEISELAVPSGDLDALRKVLAPLRATGAAYAIAHLPGWLTAADRVRAGFVRRRGPGVSFAAWSSGSTGLPDDLHLLRRWDLQLDDLTSF